jgi:hypothetical protein
MKNDSNGLNGGKNGGRVCWAISGTLCAEKVLGSFAAKLVSCTHCDFYRMVHEEESTSCLSLNEILTRLK